MIRYVFDFDGTLCETDKGRYEKSKPIQERIDLVNKLYDEGNLIIIDTARGSESGIDWHDLTKMQIKEWGIKCHLLRTGVKSYGDYYIDDKSINSEDFFKNGHSNNR